MKKAYLALENGHIFEGFSFGSDVDSEGEVVFNTGMSGYQEILTDPSYKGQIVLMTYPEIGNYGVNNEDIESSRPWVEGFIVKEYWPHPSNFRSKDNLGNYLVDHNIPGIWGIDTRMITRMIRNEGAMRGLITSDIGDESVLLDKVKKIENIEGADLVQFVTCVEKFAWHEGNWSPGEGYGRGTEYREKRGKIPHVCVLDCGVKMNILRMLVSHGFKVTVFPAMTPFEEIKEARPDALFISNGPGDPEGVPYVVDTVVKAIGVLPVFGICLGHQIVGLALNGSTYKLKFGHHGINHPTMDLETGRVEITSQNHNFAIDPDSLEGRANITHVNLNDGTVEGMEVPHLNIVTVQYHPESSPGPHDSRYLFERFYNYLEQS